MKHVMFPYRFLAFSVVMVCLLSCATDKVAAALKSAGDNRAELEKVLSYFESTGDREKVAAAKFIIGNMPGHISMWGEYESYWKDADRMLSASEGALGVLDSLEVLKGKYDGRIFYDYDLKRITADYLIHDIETAFDQWRNGEWARHLTFDEFCEWLLPYTCTDMQPLIDWRDSLAGFARGFIDHLNECDEFIGNPRAAITRVNNKLIPMIAKQRWVHAGHGYPIYDPNVFVKLPGASCDEYMCNGILIMRSKGIPVGMDYTPQFSDRKYGHYWNVFPNIRRRTTVFTSFGINPDYPHYNQAKFAKVLRRTYAPDAAYLRLLRRNHGSIPHLFDSPFFKDVTNEYMETSDVKVKLLKKRKLPSRDVYICVFDNEEWKPVFYGKARLSSATFKGMGRNVTYMVCGYDGRNSELKPVSLPFYLDGFGNVTYIGDVETTGTVSFTLRRKFPMFQHVMLAQSTLHGGMVLGSDEKMFLNPDTVCVFPEWSLTSGIVKVKQTSLHRYWRFISDRRSMSDMAELYFYDKSGVRVDMMPDTDSLNNMLDGDPLTYYTARRGAVSGVLDAGHPVHLDHVSYIRRGDGNAIVPGDTYRVSWWNGYGWVAHCEMKADDVELEIKDIPAGRLYFIEGLTRGVQNRIFTYNSDNECLVWR